MDQDGNLVRLYPVPFRLVTEEQKFAKWQWIEASIEKSPGDHRPESHKIGVDTIRGADSTTLGHSAHDHLDTHSKLTWTPAPRPLGQAVGAQRRRFA
ncbi:hypothetical protein NLO93_27835, partial [Pseudomonas savastanoi]|nr:hypothetical protein [Pseudomonas savastanoi]